MPRRPAFVPQDDQDDDLDDAREAAAVVAAPLPEPEDLVAKARKILGKNSGAIKVYLKREPDGEFPYPLTVQSVDDLYDLVRLVFDEHGGGDFFFRARINGQFVNGSWEPLHVPGEPLPFRQKPARAEATTAAPPLAASPVVDVERIKAEARADTLREIAEADDRERRESERQARAIEPVMVALKAITERLTAPPPAPATPAAPPAKTLAEQYLEKKLLADETAPNPEILALRGTVEALGKQLAELAAAKKEKREPDQVERAIGRLLKLRELQEAAKMLTSEDDDPIDLDFKALAKDVLSGLLPDRKTLKKLGKTLAETVTNAAARSSGQQGVPVPPTFALWAKAFLEDASRAADVAWVRASLQLYRPQIEGACRISSKAELVAFAREHLGDAVGQQVEKLTDVQANLFLTLVARLRASVGAADAPEPQPQHEEEEPDDDDPLDESNEDDLDEDADQALDDDEEDDA